MNETVLLIAALAAVMLITIIYIAVKDRETSRKLSMMEAGIDGLNRELFKMAKEIETLEKMVEEGRLTAAEEASDTETLDRMVNRKLKPFVLEVEHLGGQIGELERIRERLDALETKIRQALFANEHTAPDEQKILQLHAQGMDAESIAKQLRLGKGEVELVLKFSKLGGFS